jgi:ADP-ribose pyrophosphatase
MIFKGKIISLQVDQVTLPNGGTASREIVKHPGAVAVIPLLGDKMIVVEQYRKPLEKSQVEIPAGKLDSGEEPLRRPCVSLRKRLDISQITFDW